MKEKEYLEIIKQWKEENKELIKSGECRKIFLDNLPRNKNRINWKESQGIKVFFIYKKYKDWIKIINRENTNIRLEYNNKEYKLNYKYFINCKFGKILGVRTKEFKIEIGQTIKDDKRDITIINRKYIKNKNGCNQKWYKYHCNKCDNEDWIIEYALLNGYQGCNVCCTSPNKIKLGINTIYDTDKWMIPYIGEENAKKYSSNSTVKLNIKCPICEKISNNKISLNNLYRNKYICKNCSDGISYPNKVMFNLLSQLKKNNTIDDFEAEKRFYWCKYYNSYKNKECFGIYDFYIPSKKLIIEMDGGFHNRDNNMSGQTKEESQWIDNIKDNLAKEHGFKIIRINCDYKNNSIRFEHIRNNIIHSKLNNILNFYNVDWNIIEEQSENNLIKRISNYFNEHNDITFKEFSKIFNISTTSLREYLKKGTKLGWCNYNPTNKRYLKVIKNNFIKGIFYTSLSNFERKSIDIIGEKLRADDISEVIRGIKKQYKGYYFVYTNKKEFDEFNCKQI